MASDQGRQPLETKKMAPKPEVEIPPANQGIVSREEFFVQKEFEQINQYFFPALFIRNWKPKAELLYPSVSDETAIQYECDFNRNVQNCFVEDNAEEVFLRTPPPCFVVIGKYGASVSKLSQKLADEFGSVLIQVDDIINQLLQTQTETSKVLDRLLRLGVSLTLNFILALSSFVAHTAEARHRGYVLCGLPCIPDSYDLSAEQQFNYLFTWDNKPTVFINVLFDDEDLIKERTSSRCEIRSFGSESCIVHHELGLTEVEEDAEEDDDEEKWKATKEETSSFEGDIDISPSRPWVQLPRDEEAQVWHELELFDNKIRPAIKLLISRVDPQYFITVDSRVENEFEMVMARLSLLQIWKVPLPVPFISPKRRPAISERSTSLENLTTEGEEEEEAQSFAEYDEIDADLKRAAKEPPAAAFSILFAKNTISPKFRWELSHYNYICPVSLREGEIAEGKSEFAVVFMKYIYFLRDEPSMLKFLQNPRVYVLPVRPLPLQRFIIIGYPYSGKTSVSRILALEFGIPLIDVNTVLKNDLDRKKEIYQEFCRQKAECREMIRLNAQAWQDWRTEEEHRITLIEGWISYIQTLLTQRMEHFYCRGESEAASVQSKEIHTQDYSLPESAENVKVTPGEASSKSSGRASSKSSGRASSKAPLAVHGVGVNIRSPGEAPNDISPSEKLIKALKHEDFDFNDPNLEVEANLFFSSLWNTFSSEDQRLGFGSIIKEEELDEYGEDQSEPDRESGVVNWCSLLPPQSLSSFLMSKVPYTTRQKRQSFGIFLEAASKAYWAPCKLKTEFAKWRLPCYMDIPLCEIFLDNPILLLRYVPEWLKERPLIPDPVDPSHPGVVEAGRVAHQRAGVVNIKQNKEEVAVLIRDAVEKAEREGMRVTGEVISPGGWVLDNMSLDLDVWKKLACEGVFADHIYILVDTEPEHLRIIRTWCELNRTSLDNWDSFENEEDEEKEEEKEEEEEEEVERGEEEEQRIGQKLKEVKEVKRTISQPGSRMGSEEIDEDNIMEVLKEIVRLNFEEDDGLDDIFDKLLDEIGGLKGNFPLESIDVFSYHLLQNTAEAWSEFKEDTKNEDSLMAVQLSSHKPSVSFLNKHFYTPLQSIPIGPELKRFTAALLNSFKKKPPRPEEKQRQKQTAAESLQFFIFLLTLPKKLESLKDWLTSIEGRFSVTEIVITGKSPEDAAREIRKLLFKGFSKRPRELEEFEVEEIKRSEKRQKKLLASNFKNSEYEAEEEDEDEEEGEEGEEDIRIFGESGPLCIVNLERDIFLLGKPEFALRYYGKLYYFWDENAKNKFKANPQKYAPYYSVIRCYPPLRIYVTGPIGSGKTSLATAVANQLSLTYVDYPKFLMQSLVPHSKMPCQKFSAVGDSKLLLSEDYNAAARLVKEKFMNAPYELRQFWFENPVYEDPIDNSLKFHSQVIKLSEPIVQKNYPELHYECTDDENDLVKTSSSDQGAPYVSMKALEALLNAYFQSAEELTDYCIGKSTKVLWTTEPYISQGFVLEGFPFRYSDAKQMADNNWIPDLVIEVALPADMVVERNIDALMEFWDTKLKQEIIEEKLLEDTLISLQKVCLRQRRNELYEERRMTDLLPALPMKPEPSVRTISGSIQKEDTRKSAMELFSSLGEESQAEINEILREEFPPMTFNPNFETYDAAKVRITDNLLKNYARDSAEIAKLKATVKDMGVPWIEVDGMKNLDDNLINVFFLLDKIKKRQNCKGEFAFPITMEMAEKLLRQGYYFLSKFGRWCPVQVHRMKNPIHMFRPLSAKGKVTPIAYRNYIYFVGGENEKSNFIQDPIKYTFNAPHHPNIPVRVAIIGPPKSGKSTLCKRLGRTFDMKVVTMGSALRFVLEKMPKSTLAKSINSYLKRGCFLPLSVKVEALMASLNDPACVTQGFVFDGIPFDAALTQSLAERGKLPFIIISLVANADFGKTNREGLALEDFRLPYKNRTNLDSRYKDWNATYKRFSQWNKHTYNNLYEVNAKLNVVDIFYQAYDIIRKSFFGILYYVEYCVSDRALPLQYLCVGQHEYELRKSPFHNNCPACWVEENRLSSCSNPPPRSGLVQYLNHFYWICSNHMEKFLKHPKMYFPPEIPPPSQPFPKAITKAEFNSTSPTPKIHGHGRCPVTRVDFPSSLDWEGSWSFAAFFAGEVFLCKNKTRLDRFLARPWRYAKADTEFEVNRPTKSDAVKQLGPPKVTSLPPIGFLEQTVADSIHACLQILGGIRPVYPNMSPTTTGCTFAGLYLKVHNKRNKHRELEKPYFEFMLHNCRAFKFKLPDFRTLQSDVGRPQDVVDSDGDSNEEDETAIRSQLAAFAEGDQFCWLDLEAQADKKMWSAKVVRPDVAEMRLTSDDNLLEIPDIPKFLVVLRYQTYSLRSNPLPPVSNCLTFIYSPKPSLKIREKFNYNTLYQPLQQYTWPSPQEMIFNPEKGFDYLISNESRPEFRSQENLWKGKHTHSIDSITPPKQNPNTDPDLARMIERFIPRFQLLDAVTSPVIPSLPEMVQEEPIIFNPQRDYSYILLFSEFFLTSHVLRCFEWDEIHRQLEFSKILDRNLGLSNVQSEYFLHPRISPSVRTRRSIDSYMDAFDAASAFLVPPFAQPPDSLPPQSDNPPRQDSSLFNFIHSILLEKMEELFHKVSLASLSYDSYEINLVSAESEIYDKQNSVMIREILPYPPLPWDIDATPYYAYSSVESVFQSPHLDHIAHERHFSLLDGIIEPNDEIRFVRYPTWIPPKPEKLPAMAKSAAPPRRSNISHEHHKPVYAVYDFFNLPWTSFLTYPFSWAYNKDITGIYSNFNNEESPGEQTLEEQ